MFIHNKTAQFMNSSISQWNLNLFTNDVSGPCLLYAHIIFDDFKKELSLNSNVIFFYLRTVDWLNQFCCFFLFETWCFPYHLYPSLTWSSFDSVHLSLKIALSKCATNGRIRQPIEMILFQEQFDGSLVRYGGQLKSFLKIYYDSLKKQLETFVCDAYGVTANYE